MKKQILYLCAITLLLLAGCSSSDEQMSGELELTVGLEQPFSATVSTRAVDADLQVEVWNEDGSVLVRQFTPGQSPNRITLKAGNYLLKAFTTNYQTNYSNSELGEAKFYKEQPFTIDADMVNRISCTVPMANTAVTLTLPEGFKSWFTSYSFSVKQSSTSRNVDMAEGETVYFDCTDNDRADLIYTLTTINTDNEPNSDSSILIASAGILYHISYSWETKSLMWKGYE